MFINIVRNTQEDRSQMYNQSQLQVYSYRFHPLELAEYTRILPELSGIRMTMFVDESSSFKRWGHPMWVVVSNGDPYIGEWIAISISEKPEIIQPQDLEDSELFGTVPQCLYFVAKFHKVLFDISTERVDSDILFDIMMNCDWSRLSNASIMGAYSDLIRQYQL